MDKEMTMDAENEKLSFDDVMATVLYATSQAPRQWQALGRAHPIRMQIDLGSSAKNWFIQVDQSGAQMGVGDVSDPTVRWQTNADALVRALGRAEIPPQGIALLGDRSGFSELMETLGRVLRAQR